MCHGSSLKLCITSLKNNNGIVLGSVTGKRRYSTVHMKGIEIPCISEFTSEKTTAAHFLGRPTGHLAGLWEIGLSFFKESIKRF